jgi:hypothetical protein
LDAVFRLELLDNPVHMTGTQTEDIAQGRLGEGKIEDPVISQFHGLKTFVSFLKKIFHTIRRAEMTCSDTLADQMPKFTRPIVDISVRG